MKHLSILTTSILFLVLITGCSEKILQSNNASNNKNDEKLTSSYVPSGYELQFSDEFEAKAMDLNKWKYRIGVKQGGGYASKEIADNVSLSDGNLVVNGVFKDPKAGGSNSGGGVISIQHFKYGYYESRVKTQAGDFWHSSFWTYNSKDKNKATEIDVFERDSQYDIDDNVIKIRQNVIQHSTGKPIGVKGSTKLPLKFDPAKDYHIYGMLWEENEVKFYIDGLLTNTISYPADKYLHDETSIWLSMIARNNATENTACYFDYVRFYSKNTK